VSTPALLPEFHTDPIRVLWVVRMRDGSLVNCNSYDDALETFENEMGTCLGRPSKEPMWLKRLRKHGTRRVRMVCQKVATHRKLASDREARTVFAAGQLVESLWAMVRELEDKVS